MVRHHDVLYNTAKTVCMLVRPKCKNHFCISKNTKAALMLVRSLCTGSLLSFQQTNPPIVQLFSIKDPKFLFSLFSKNIYNIWWATGYYKEWSTKIRDGTIPKLWPIAIPENWSIPILQVPRKGNTLADTFHQFSFNIFSIYCNKFC